MLQPSVKLKPILSWVATVILSKLDVSSIATAFSFGTSTLKNASAHRNSLYSIRIDLSNFFNSIKVLDLSLAIANSSNKLPAWVSDPGTQQLLNKACFDANGRLPVGYSTSPLIANIVMLDMDKSLVRAISDRSKYGSAVLTRYADDFVFSTDKRGACRDFYLLLEDFLRNAKSPKLEINGGKTRFMSKMGGSTLITGLRVKQNGEIGVHQNYRDHVRLLLKLYSEGRLAEDEVKSLRGHLAFIKHSDPQLITKLSYKYYSEIASL